MKNTLYYGEICAKVSAQLHQNPDHYIRIANVIDAQNARGENVWSLCAEAARVFDKIEDLSSDYFIDWHRASDQYAQQILDFLLSGRKPTTIDLVSMVSNSIENSK